MKRLLTFPFSLLPFPFLLLTFTFSLFTFPLQAQRLLLATDTNGALSSVAPARFAAANNLLNNVQQNLAISCWGDSITLGTGGTYGYPYYLSQLCGLPTVNNGIGSLTSSQILTNFQAGSNQWNNLQIICAGRNDSGSNIVVTNDLAMTTALPHSNYLVLGVLTWPVETNGHPVYAAVTNQNYLLSNTFGPRFIDIRKQMISTNWFTVLGISPTADDLRAIAQDNIPSSFVVTNNGHPNDYGYKIISMIVYSNWFPSAGAARIVGNALLLSPNYLTAKDATNHNWGFGPNALTHITTGHDNMAFGDGAGTQNTIGICNTIFGENANQTNTIGSQNSAFGYNALLNNVSGNNSGFGFDTLVNTTGYGNTAVGTYAGSWNAGGTYNSFLGYCAGQPASQGTGLDHSTAIGAGAYTTQNNQMVLGDSNLTSVVTAAVMHLPTEAYALTNLVTAAGTNVYKITTNYPSILTVGTTAAALQVCLPTPQPYIAGYVVRVIDKAGTAATRNITISATNVYGQSQTINGAATYVISANYGFCHAMTDGTNWFIIGK